MLDFLRPEHAAILQQIVVGIVSMAALGMAYMAFKLTSKAFAGIGFLANVAYASPFLVGVLGFTVGGFALGDMKTGVSPPEAAQVQIVTNGGQVSNGQPGEHSQCQRVLCPASDGALLGLGIGCILYTFSVCLLRYNYGGWDVRPEQTEPA